MQFANSLEYQNSMYSTSTPSTPVSSMEEDRRSVSLCYWREENTLLYQIECDGQTISRRLDNDLVNITKIMNSMGITKRKRDTLMRFESRDVHISCSFDKRGIWIPLKRAEEIISRQCPNRDSWPEAVNIIFSQDPTRFISCASFPCWSL